MTARAPIGAGHGARTAEYRVSVNHRLAKVSRPALTVLAVAVAAILGGCGADASSRPPYPPLTRELVAAVNNHYLQAIYTPPISFSMASASVSPSKDTAAKRAVKTVIHGCNEGTGTRVVGVGLVNASFSSQPIFGVFMNPPGPHISPSSGGLAAQVPSPGVRATSTTQPAIPLLNWYAGFIRPSSGVFCTFGQSPQLPELPVHG